MPHTDSNANTIYYWTTASKNGGPMRYFKKTCYASGRCDTVPISTQEGESKRPCGIPYPIPFHSSEALPLPVYGCPTVNCVDLQHNGCQQDDGYQARYNDMHLVDNDMYSFGSSKRSSLSNSNWLAKRLSERKSNEFGYNSIGEYDEKEKRWINNNRDVRLGDLFKKAREQTLADAPELAEQKDFDFNPEGCSQAKCNNVNHQCGWDTRASLVCGRQEGGNKQFNLGRLNANAKADFGVFSCRQLKKEKDCNAQKEKCGWLNERKSCVPKMLFNSLTGVTQLAVDAENKLKEAEKVAKEAAKKLAEVEKLAATNTNPEANKVAEVAVAAAQESAAAAQDSAAAAQEAVAVTVAADENPQSTDLVETAKQAVETADVAADIAADAETKANYYGNMLYHMSMQESPYVSNMARRRSPYVSNMARRRSPYVSNAGRYF
jgi:hypothetical protein